MSLTNNTPFEKDEVMENMVLKNLNFNGSF